VTFTLKLDLEPGMTYAEIKRQVELVASKLPDDDGSKPDGPHRINIKHSDPTGNIPWVRGEWRIDNRSPIVETER
jgi:hypothetical protein